MAGQGPPPKDRRRRRNVDPIPTTVVAQDEVLRGPELPDGVDWHERTVAWWLTWRRSAQAQTFVDTDWSFLLDTALMHSAMWSKGQWTLAAEVRLRAAKFGATPEDRARLRLRVDTPAVQGAERAVSGSDRRARMRVVGQ